MKRPARAGDGRAEHPTASASTLPMHESMPNPHGLRCAVQARCNSCLVSRETFLWANPCGRCPTGCDQCLDLKKHAERHALKCILSEEKNKVQPRKYKFADLADECGTPWPEIQELMPKAIEAVESAFHNNEKEPKNADNNHKKAMILTAVPDLIAEKTPAEELKELRDLVLQRREERIEQKKRSK